MGNWGPRRRKATKVMQDYDARKWKWSRLVVSNFLQPHGLYLPGSSIHGIFQARLLECIAISFSRGSSQSRDRTPVSCRQDRLLQADSLPSESQEDLNCSATFDEGCPSIALNHRVNKIMSNKDIGFYRISSLKVPSFLPISSNNHLFTFVEWKETTALLLRLFQIID